MAVFAVHLTCPPGQVHEYVPHVLSALLRAGHLLQALFFSAAAVRVIREQPAAFSAYRQLAGQSDAAVYVCARAARDAKIAEADLPPDVQLAGNATLVNLAVSCDRTVQF